MGDWNIVADSSCDLFAADISCDQTQFATVPFIIRIGETDYIDTEDMDVEQMLGAMEACDTVSQTSCPAPSVWAEEFRKAQNSVAITISGRLSGSLNSADAAKVMVQTGEPDRNIITLDSRSTGPGLVLCIWKLREWISQGFSIDEIKQKAEDFLAKQCTVFALCSYDNLIKAGRMGKIAGFIARKLGMWGVGVASIAGEIRIVGKAKGKVKAAKMIIDDLKLHSFDGGNVVISHCQNLEMAERIKDMIVEHWHNAQVTILKTRGLDTFYAERGGIIMAYGSNLAHPRIP